MDDDATLVSITESISDSDSDKDADDELEGPIDDGLLALGGGIVRAVFPLTNGYWLGTSASGTREVYTLLHCEKGLPSTHPE